MEILTLRNTRVSSFKKGWIILLYKKWEEEVYKRRAENLYGSGEAKREGFERIILMNRGVTIKGARSMSYDDNWCEKL